VSAERLFVATALWRRRRDLRLARRILAARPTGPRNSRCRSSEPQSLPRILRCVAVCYCLCTTYVNRIITAWSRRSLQVLFIISWYKDQFPIQGIQHYGTSCLELSVSSYEKFRYHHHFQGTSENWTVLRCIRHGLTFLLPPVLRIRTLRHSTLPINIFDIWHLTFAFCYSAKFQQDIFRKLLEKRSCWKATSN